MEHPWLFLIGVLRALLEVSMLFLAGQGVLALLAGARRESNPIYRLFLILTRPILKIMRAVAPAQIIDRHLPFVAFFLLFWGWIALAWLKKLYCDTHQLQCF